MYRGSIGMMENQMETTLGFRGLGIMKRFYGDSEKKMEATIFRSL